MTVTQLSELHIGRAGEHVAAADLLLKGYDCFPAAQGMPYDLVADCDSWLYKVQVKATLTTRAIPQHKDHVPAYLFWVNRCGKDGVKGYARNEVDIFALVALDTKEVGYIEVHRMPKTLIVRSSLYKGQYLDERVGARNNAVRRDLAAGMTVPAVCQKYELDRAYAHRIKREPEYTKSKSLYLADLTLSKAIGIQK